MPQNLTQIANSALVKLGANTLSSLSDSTREAQAAAQRIVPIIHNMLRSHPWTFAFRFVSLAPLVAPVVEQWTYTFQIPTDCLRIRSLTTGGSFPSAITTYEIVGDKIYTNESDLFIRYVSTVVESIESPPALPDDFAEAAAAMLAYDIAPSVTSSLPMREDLYALHSRLLAAARFNGSVENPSMSTNSTAWLDSRNTASFDDRSQLPLDV
jgi:hypothetical protein